MKNPNGFYTVGDEKTYNKIYALVHATEKKCIPQWNYFDDVFAAVDRTIIPVLSLSHLYKERALQLREKYDYLILNYSGGSDSHNILTTFLENKIKLDCVFVQWHVSLTDKNLYTKNPSIKTNDNFHSEWDLTLKKDLEWLAKYHPNIKIEVKDWVKSFAEDFYNDTLFEINAGVMPNISRGLKLNTFSDTETEMANKGLKVASIFGVDKPNVVSKDGCYYFYFTDKSCMTQPNPSNPDGVEYFYISPDMPELTTTQAYQVAMWFSNQKKRTHLIKAQSQRPEVLNFKLKDFFNEYEEYCEIVKEICYPNWDFNRFQAGKPVPGDNNLPYGLKPWDNILIKAGILKRAHEGYKFHWASYLREIDQRYIREGEPIGIKSKWHFLGKLDEERY